MYLLNINRDLDLSKTDALSIEAVEFGGREQLHGTAAGCPRFGSSGTAMTSVTSTSSNAATRRGNYAARSASKRARICKIFAHAGQDACNSKYFH
jgi:hypothetical protein